jgi:hypothetical protein
VPRGDHQTPMQAGFKGPFTHLSLKTNISSYLERDMVADSIISKDSEPLDVAEESMTSDSAEFLCL